MSRQLVAITYGAKPELFDGRLGDPLQPITAAAVSLAGGLTCDGFEVSTTATQLVFLALGNLLREAAVHGNRYDLGEADLRHLKVAEAAYLEHEGPVAVCAVGRETGGKAAPAGVAISARARLA
jgi:hypothetical protein